MEFTFGAGMKFQSLTPDELTAALGTQTDALTQALREPDVISEARSHMTDASGNLPSGYSATTFSDQALSFIYRVPPGMIAIIHRINVEAAGYNRSAPYTSGYINFAVDYPSAGNTLVGLPANSTALLPCTIVDSLTAAMVVKGGQVFGAYGAGLPASTEITFRIQAVLKETEK